MSNMCRSPLGLEAFVTAQRRPWSSWPMVFVVVRCHSAAGKLGHSGDDMVKYGNTFGGLLDVGRF